MAPARRLRKRRNPEEKPADGNRGEDAAVAASPQEVISKRKRKVTRKREEEEEAGAKTPADSIAGRTSLASKVAAKKRKTEEISLSLPCTARQKKETLRKEASPAPSTGEGAPLVKPHRPLTSPAAKLAEKVKTARTKRAPLEGRASNGRSVSPSRKKQTRVLKASKSTSKPRDESDCEVTEPTPRATTASRRKLPPEGAARKPRGRLSTKVRADGDSQRENPQAVSLSVMLKEEPSVKYGGGGKGGGGGGDADGVSPQAGPSGKESPKKESPKKTLKGEMMSSESSESEWEEVQDFSHPPLPPPLVKPAVQHDIKITVKTEADKKKKDKYSAESYFKSLWNKLSKDVRTSLHQVHLLCYLSHGLHCSSVCNSEELQAVALSLLPARYTVAAATAIDRAVLTALINWFKSFVVVETDDFQRMSDCLATRRVPSSREYIPLFAIFLRSLSVLTRLVYNLQPTSLKPESQAKVYKKQPVKKSVKGGGKQTKRRSRGQRHTMRRRRAATNPEFTDSDEETFRDPKQETDERVVRKMRKIDRTEVSTPGGSRKSTRTRPTPTNYKVGVSSSDDGDGDDSNVSDDMDKVDQSPEKKLQQFRRESLKEKKARQTARKKKQEQLSDNSDTELVRELDRLESWGTQKSAKNRSMARSAESDDDPQVVSARGPSNDLWLEFYVKSKNRWTCFDCITGSIDDPRDLERRASQPIHYVVGIDNDNCTKDLTPRYASDWMTNARRFRTDGDWWADTLATRQCQDLLRDKEEDLQLKDDMLAMPLPSSVSEFKGHPLYALRRHLLKFEAIYPPTAQPLGIIRGEPVYARYVFIQADNGLMRTFQRMSDCLATRRVPSSREYILLFAIFLRSLSVLTRLVYNLQPTSLKPESQAKVYKKQPVKKSVKGGGKQTKRRSRGQRHTMRRRRAATNPEFTDSDEETFRDPKQETDERVVRKMRKIDRTEVSTPGGSRKSTRTRPTPTNYKVGVSSSDDGDGDFSDDMDKVDQSPEKKLQQFRRESLKEKKARQTARKKKQEELSDNSDTELVRELDRLESWGTQKSVKNRSLSRSAKSDDDQEVVYARGPSNDLWLEFYVKSKNRWTCFDCITGSIDDPRDLERRASQPIHYVVGIDNDNCTKDLTPRYASDWMTNARRFRTDGDWWADTLATRQCQDLLRDKEEDLQLKDDMLAMPLPSSVSEFKGHPLYALRRHLLKFEAIYPPTAQPLGIIRGEPVYARECVRNLHSKETWLKEARSIKKDEKAYKMVKPRPKRGESTGEPMAATLKVYGEWQTEPYQSPPVENGIIPRNDYGNVELFQPSMLPPGAVHLNLAGLHKVAKKLGVDCVAAMVGWDFHGGWNHPVMDGYVVCEEHEVILRAAWQQEQDEADRKQREKREKKVLARWKLLVKGLLIRERLRRRWDLRHPPACGTSSQEESTAASVEAAWPRNFDSGERDTYHLFPFEKK
ncbi:PREDICTED: DNA repair protein complementing XP-C cells homolog [Priapulus caudatus]|uniref:DNA repair protein complementing XP-C cells homolog n=1 Tax=Priapulus caudatus TaxID=37621 RepID=A0ABM1E8C8_PRICU|nr:PREDICTED: DNA repair protein complementing XP-C cells homolog [Priapulus caudatus]